MNYYTVALLNKPLLLAYKSGLKLQPGSIVFVPVKGKPHKGVIIKECTKPSFKCEEILKVEEEFYFSKEQLHLARFISTYYFSELGEALSLFVPFSKKQENHFRKVEKEIPLSLTQKKALSFLKKNRISLLFGDTGSGKTQIYMSYFKEILNQGKRAIFLMPEISLTPQMEKRLKEFFDERVVVWHSQLTKKQREKAVEKIYSGEAKIVAGPRSALFLPIKDLGLIVVDEEHDESYKAQNRPRINAKDLAVYIGSKFDVPVVLGSATPSAVSYHRYPFFRLKGSFFKGKRKFIFKPNLDSLLFVELKKVLEAKKQALIFVPTRANFKYLICQDCGEAIKCPHCDVGMSVHFDKRALICHYCNFSEYIPRVCPSCYSSQLSTSRVGTTEIVNTLQEKFPEAKIVKFDKDTISTHKKLVKTLKEFEEKKIDVLVGTQMLSKGHDYPDIALAVILDIDYLLAQADFRAREKALSLFLQVAGRAGRKEDATVLVQTRNAEFFKHYLDYERFLKDELKLRQDRYPPFVRMAQLLFSHKRKEKARIAMEEMVEGLKQFKEVEIVGYGESAIERIAGKFRYHILLKSNSSKALINAIYKTKHPLCEVDMDPLNLL
ncbi:MAG: primosomal protein N' [Epsilonproteobacteria bacterium]|nr:primosomal protein N' [Campylobacterota bacterium]